jgi:hypothetical protein
MKVVNLIAARRRRVFVGLCGNRRREDGASGQRSYPSKHKNLVSKRGISL